MGRAYAGWWDELHRRPRWETALDSAVGCAIMVMGWTFVSVMLLGENLGPREWRLAAAAYSAAWSGLYGIAYGGVLGYLLKFT